MTTTVHSRRPPPGVSRSSWCVPFFSHCAVIKKLYHVTRDEAGGTSGLLQRR